MTSLPGRIVGLAGVAIFMLTAGCGAPDSDRVASQAPEETTAAETVPSGPPTDTAEALRPDGAFAWTGSALFSFGGTQVADGSAEFVNSAALVDVESGNVTTLPSPETSSPVGSPYVAAVPSGVVVAGFACDRVLDDGNCDPGGYLVLHLNENANEWSSIGLPETADGIENGQLDLLGPTSDGRVVLRLGEAAAGSPPEREQFWLLDPAQSSWTPLPAAPTRVDEVCMAGDNLVTTASTAVSGSGDVLASVDEPDYGGADSYTESVVSTIQLVEPAESWQTSEPAPISAAARPPALACGGEHAVLVAKDEGGSAAYNIRSHSWQAAEGQPDILYPHEPVWTGEELVFLDGGSGAQRLDPQTMTVVSSNSGLGSVDRLIWTDFGIKGFVEREDGAGYDLVTVDL